MSQIEECILALDDEIAATQDRGKRPIDLAHGTLLGNFGEDSLYVFEADQEITLADNTPIRLQVAAEMVPGSIESKQGYHIFILLSRSLGSHVPAAKLHCEPWFLLEELKQRLLSASWAQPQLYRIFEADANLLTPTPQACAAALIARIQSEYGSPVPVNAGQLAAISQAINSPVTFVWGPPGTGKTYTLGLTANCLIKTGQRVLIVAHSNAAVDVAVVAAAKFLKRSDDYQKGCVLRYGYSENPLLKNCSLVTAKGILAAVHSKDVEKITELEQRRRDYLKVLTADSTLDWHKRMAAVQLREVNAALVPLSEEMRAREQELVSRAKITVCTLSKAAIDKRIYEQRFDSVLIDEASMAYIPQCLFAASLARSHVAVFGDFRQLPPIAIAETQSARRWLKRDIFQYAVIEAVVNKGRSDSRLAVLTAQYRMHPGIVAIINPLYYGGRLTTDEPTTQATQLIADRMPAASSPLVLLNTSRFPHFCFAPYRSGSRFNPYSALVAIEVASQIIKRDNISVGIVTPFRSQARLLTALARDQGLGDQLRASTVHLFQGQERDVIIFDPVIAKPAENCILMEGGITSQAARLANVAISRAKGKFIVVTDPLCIGEILMPHDAFRTLLLDVAKQASQHALCMPPQTSRGVMGSELKGVTWVAAAAFPAVSADFRGDLQSAAQHVLIHYPFSYTRHVEERWFQDQAVTARQFVTESTNSGLFADGTRFTKAPCSPQKHTAAFGMDGETLWLLTAPQGIAVRIQLKRTVACLYSLLNLSPEGGFDSLGVCPLDGSPLWMRLNEMTSEPEIHCTKAVCEYHHPANPFDLTRHARLSNQRCPRCGGEMVGRRSQYGRIFLACASANCQGLLSPRDYV